MASTASYAGLVTLATDSDDDPTLLYDITDKVKIEAPEGAKAIAYAVKRRFAYPNTDIKRRVLGLVDTLVIECGPDFHNAFIAAGFLTTLADNRDKEIAKLIPEHLEKWKDEMGSEYHAVFNQTFTYKEGSHPTSAHFSSKSTPYLLFGDRPITNGIYTITNVHHKRFVYLENSNDTTLLRGHFSDFMSRNRNAQWHIRSRGNGEYSIQNVEHSCYAYCGQLAGVKACVQGYSTEQLWCIQARHTQGYTIATTDTRNLWMLPDGPNAPVELFNIFADPRCWWTLEKQKIEAPANENLTAQSVVSEQSGLVAVAEIPVIPVDMDLDVPESEPHLAERFGVGHVMPGDMELDAVESEPYLAQRFGVHVPNLSGQIRRLSEGTMFPGTYSTVYPGMYEDKKVAIKVLRMVKKSDNIERKFRRELLIWWHLKHDNVLPLYGYFEEKEDGHGFPSLISKWAENESAAQYISHDLKWDQRTSLFYDVAKGLNYLHGFNPTIVHADLKPQNVVVNIDGVGQLCDFGLTRFMQEELESGLTTTTAHTGTTRYLAYELVEYADKPIPTTATDMYALGCVGLEFIYQVPPHASLGMNLGRIIRTIGNGIPPSKRPANPEGVTPILWDLVEACWIITPEERPTAAQVSEYLEKNLEALSESLKQCWWRPEYYNQ